MNVLVACEYSGIVRDAFENKGWNAWSCDLLPTESEQTKASGKHYENDVLEILNPNIFRTIYPTKFGHLPEKWDLLIAHPPCTYLTYAGVAHWNNPGRLKERLNALQFFANLWEAPIEHICIENPRGCASPTIAKYSQIVQPYYLGKKYNENKKKTTCLWLKNLPLLIHSDGDLFQEKTSIEKEPDLIQIGKNKDGSQRIYKRGWCDVHFGKNTGHLHSRFWAGIADAMAEQWTEYLIGKI
jgi:hypothetical protein